MDVSAAGRQYPGDAIGRRFSNYKMSKQNERRRVRKGTYIEGRSRPQKSSSIRLPLGYRMKGKSLYWLVLVPICMSALFALMVLLSSGEVSTDEWEAREALTAVEEEEVARRAAEIIAAQFERAKVK